MRDTILWRLRAKECAWIDCDTKYEWISDIRNNEMKITKSQLKQIIKEEYDAYSIESIRERGDAMEMAQEVSEIMNSMGPSALSGKEAYDMIVDAINTDPAAAAQFWDTMLSPQGPLLYREEEEEY